MNVNYAVTVRKLYEDCKRVIKNGGGNKEILITSDDECNSYHALWYTFIDDSSEVSDMLKLTPVDNYDIDNANNIVLLG